VIEKFFECNTTLNPSICEQVVFPRLTAALIYQSTSLQGASNKISVWVYFNQALVEGSVLSLSGFTGSGTQDGELALSFGANPEMSEMISELADWEQSSGTLLVTLTQEVSDYISFSFAVLNAEQDNPAANVSVSCMGCLDVEAASPVIVEDIVVATSVLKVDYVAPSCQDTTKFGAECSSVCAGIVRGGVCVCETGYFGYDCSQQATVTAQISVNVVPGEAAVVSVPSGEGVDIPAGAIAGSDAVPISLSVYDVLPSLSSSQAALVPVGNVVQFGPSGQKFTDNVTLTLSYTPALVASGYTVKGFWLNEGSGLWESIGGSAQNGGLLTALTSHFSKFAVMAVEIPVAAAQTTTSTTTTVTAPTTIAPTTSPSTTPVPVVGGGGENTATDARPDDSGGAGTTTIGTTTPEPAGPVVIPQPEPAPEKGSTFNVGAVVGVALACGVCLLGAFVGVYSILRRQQMQPKIPSEPVVDPETPVENDGFVMDPVPEREVGGRRASDVPVITSSQPPASLLADVSSELVFNTPRGVEPTPRGPPQPIMDPTRFSGGLGPFLRRHPVDAFSSMAVPPIPFDQAGLLGMPAGSTISPVPFGLPMGSAPPMFSSPPPMIPDLQVAANTRRMLSDLQAGTSMSPHQTPRAQFQVPLNVGSVPPVPMPMRSESVPPMLSNQASGPVFNTIGQA